MRGCSPIAYPWETWSSKAWRLPEASVVGLNGVGKFSAVNVSDCRVRHWLGTHLAARAGVAGSVVVVAAGARGC